MADQCNADHRNVKIWTRSADAGAVWEDRGDHTIDDIITVHGNSAATVVFASANKMRLGKEKVLCKVCSKRISAHLGMPAFWWTEACKRTNGYFGCDDRYDADGNFVGQNTWFRLMIKHMLPEKNKDTGKDYEWFKYNIFTRWLATGQTIAVIFDLKTDISKEIPKNLFEFDGPPAWNNPYWIHSQILENFVSMQDLAVWGIRDLVRGTELARTDVSRPNPDYPHLHDVSRHAIHVSETLQLATKTVNSINTHHDEFMKNWKRREGYTEDPPDENAPVAKKTKYEENKKKFGVEDRVAKRISDRLRFYDDMITGLLLRNASNEERLTNEIHLAYNTVAQFIGDAARVDSAAMKTVAYVTLLFLPATFVSAMFSMSFFNFQPKSTSNPAKWSMSHKFWIYWVITIPLTIITITFWMVWERRFMRKPLNKLAKKDAAAAAKQANAANNANAANHANLPNTANHTPTVNTTNAGNNANADEKGNSGPGIKSKDSPGHRLRRLFPHPNAAPKSPA